MSKTQALLKYFKEQKEQENFQRKVTVPALGLSAKTLSFWIVSVIIVIMLLMLLIFDQKLFSMVKENAAENFANSEKLNKIENMLQDYARQASVNGDIIHKISGLLDKIETRLKDTEDNLATLKETNEEKFAQLKETVNTQVSAIQSLKKEKDTIFEKIISLETEIEKIKVENAKQAASNITSSITASIE